MTGVLFHNWPWLGLAYLAGALPFGLLFQKLFGTPDLRTSGSQNIGATNMMRVGGRLPAFCTLLCDGGKGAAVIGLAALFATQGAMQQSACLLIGGVAIIGHNFPVWLRFRGGKGVATSLGVLLASAPIVGVIACATWLVVAFVFRYSSLAALTSLGICPLVFWGMGDGGAAIIMTAIAVLVWGRHHGNIARLLRGVEGKIS
ncbi:MAG: glycerol-3-phosphate 1-O-acyltransferase PlsY [Pseudomonadota bacterium]